MASALDIDGVSPVAFKNLNADDYYVAVYHRNHIAAMTTSVIALTTDPLSTPTADLTTGNAYGGASATAILSGAIRGLWGGDASGNGEVQNTDIENFWKPTTGQAGYEPADFNLNGQVQNTDLENIWKPDTGNGSQIPTI